LSVLGRIELGESNVVQRAFAVPIDGVCWGLLVRGRVEFGESCVGLRGFTGSGGVVICGGR
jgi:hypothetical protein